MEVSPFQRKLFRIGRGPLNKIEIDHTAVNDELCTSAGDQAWESLRMKKALAKRWGPYNCNKS